MSISFSGLVSGLDTSSWVEALVSVKQQKVSTLNTELKGYESTKNVLNDMRSTTSSLRTAVEKLTDAKFGGTFDLFSLNNATSSNSDVFTATATTNAKRQNYTISVSQLATYTKATSKEPASAVADESTKLQNLGITSGKLTAYINGHKNSIEITDSTTFGDFKSQMAEIGISAEIDEDGILHLSAENPDDTIHVGATTDTSNMNSLFGLERQEDGSYASTTSLYKSSISSKLTSEDSGFNTQITKGTFTIGSAEFTIDDNTTLASLIAEINSNTDAQANAYWDDATGRLSITSAKEGASYINIEAGTSNFTDVMNFTTSAWDEDGNLLSSRMYTDAQELGKNALFTINGNNIVSASNTVTSDISRIEGVTLTLNRVSTEDDGNVTLKVTQDTSNLTDALKSFVSAYNSFIDKVDEVTSSDGGALHGETTLTSLRNTIRGYANGANDTNGGIYKLLADIGISTSSADAGNISGDTESLQFDENKFLQALAENPESVKSLIAGDNGIFNMIENSVEQSLKASSGFFDVKSSTLDSDIKKVSSKITKQNSSISSYKAQLEKKFQAMENMIATMQQNYSSFLT